MKRIISGIILLCMLAALPAFAYAESIDTQKIVEQLVVSYGTYGEEAEPVIDGLLQELRSADPDAAEKWESILALWKEANTDLSVNPGVLPDGLPDTDELGIVVLGFQLNPDGTMKNELVERLKVALSSAEKYPNAYVICTGGGTASENEAATEAGTMADWLIENGLESSRVIVEDRSRTTAQNAMYTFDILTEQYPQVSQLAIVSSDYHIATGTLLFGAEAILRGDSRTVVSNAAYKAPSGMLSTMFQAGALIELSGDMETAFEVYFEEYDIHELPSLPKPEWDMSIPTELTEEIQAVFDEAMKGLVGVNYVPVAVLGVQGDTYCILCKATVVYPGATPYNVLVYVSSEGIQNIYELWIDKHSENTSTQTADGTGNCA